MKSENIDRIEYLSKGIDLAEELGGDEERVFAALVDMSIAKLLGQLSRLEGGRKEYGRLKLRHDRDWATEAYEEELDREIYHACAMLAQKEETK